MAQAKSKTPARKLTWQEKLDQNKKLNVLDEVKADADFNYRFRLREKEAREAFEKLKNRGRLSEDVQRLQELDAEEAEVDAGEGDDK